MPLPHVQPTTADPRRRLASSPTGGGLRWGGEAGAAATSAPPPNASQPLPCPVETCPEPVEACPEPVEGGTLEPPGAGGPGRQPDLRVNVAKCRRMSHFFIPPLGECRTLRVKNLTIWAHSRPFRPISVQFGLHLPSSPCPESRHSRAPTREPTPPFAVSRGCTCSAMSVPDSISAARNSKAF